MSDKFSWQSAAETLFSPILGLALEGHNDRRQLRQQEELQRLQIAGQKEMMDYGMAKQLQMWKDTNYSATVEQMKLAGVNPALLYAKAGGGGVTGSPTGAVTGGNAPQGGKEVMDITGMQLQRSMIAAQIKLAEAQANKTNVEANKIGGVDTANVDAQTQLLAQELDNRREDYMIKRLQQTMMHIENFEKQTSQEDRLQQIQTATQTAMRQLSLLNNQGKISDATVQDQIRLIQQHAIGAAIANEATQAGIQLTQAQIQKVAQEITASKKQLTLQEMETIFKTNFPSIGQTTGRIFNDAIEAIFKITAGQRTPHTQPQN